MTQSKIKLTLPGKHSYRVDIQKYASHFHNVDIQKCALCNPAQWNRNERSNVTMFQIDCMKT